MKKYIKFKKTIFVIFLFSFSLLLKAQQVEKHKTVTKTFKAYPETSVQITNKYGNINVVTWNSDSVQIDADLKIIEREDKAEKILNKIDFNFTSSQFYIIAKTVFNDFKGTVLADISDMATTTISGGNKVEITWTLHIPEKTALTLDNKFGNIYTTNHNGKLDIYISNGDLKANNLYGDSKIQIEFGNCNINAMKKGNITLSYSEMELQSASKINIDSRSSKINIGKVGEIDIISKRDKFFIDTADAINLNADFSYTNISYLKNNIFSKTKYGNLKIDGIDAGFKYINLNPNYSETILSFNKELSFSLNIATKKTTTSFPESINAFEKTIVNKDNEEYKISGIVGQKKDLLPEVQINATYGSVVVKMK